MVGQLLDRPLVVQVPDNHLHVRASCQEVVLMGLLRVPVYVEDVHNVTIFKLFEGLDTCVRGRVKQCRCLSLPVVDRQDLVDAQNAIVAAGRQEFAVLTELDDPDGLLTH